MNTNEADDINHHVDHLFTPIGPDGEPEPTLDLFELTLRAKIIAYEIASMTGDPEAIRLFLGSLIDSEGVSAKWVFYAVLQSLLVNVTTPLVEAAAKRGFDPRIGYRLTAERLAAEGDPR
jgi:hypothetical protein